MWYNHIIGWYYEKRIRFEYFVVYLAIRFAYLSSYGASDNIFRGPYPCFISCDRNDS